MIVGVLTKKIELLDNLSMLPKTHITMLQSSSPTARDLDLTNCTELFFITNHSCSLLSCHFTCSSRTLSKTVLDRSILQKSVHLQTSTMIDMMCSSVHLEYIVFTNFNISSLCSVNHEKQITTVSRCAQVSPKIVFLKELRRIILLLASMCAKLFVAP